MIPTPPPRPYDPPAADGSSKAYWKALASKNAGGLPDVQLVLESAGVRKINAIAAIHDVTKLGLAESKEIADNVPQDLTLLLAVPPLVAKQKLEAAGGEVTLIYNGEAR